MEMLSDDGLETFISTEPPASTIDGVMVTSTGSGPVVRFTVDVETPQPWSPSATHTSVGRGEVVPRVRRFIDTADTLIVREPSRRSVKASSAVNPTDSRI